MQDTKKTKRKLRKWVMISFPVAVLIAVFTIIAIINKTNSLAQVVTTPEVSSENLINENDDNPGFLSQNTFVTDLSKNINKRKLDNTIIFYATKFKLNVAKVVEIARSLTNNYEDELYKQTFIIATSNIRSSFGPYTNAESGAVEFVRELYRYPEKFGYSIPEIRASEEVSNSRRYNESGHILLDNGLTFEQFLAKMCEIYNVDKTLALAIVYEESGRMTSGLFSISNNIGGQRGYAGWLQYPTLEAGVIGFVVSLNNMGERYQIDVSTPSSAYALSSIYVSGHVGSPSDSWTGKINNYINIINNTNPFA